MSLHSPETDRDKTREMTPMKALGMIEVYGLVAAVEALDSALKAANVKTVEVTPVKGGLVAVMVTGDVGAVNAAVAAAAAAAARVGQVISTHVIPRPAEGTRHLLGNESDGYSGNWPGNNPGGKPFAPESLKEAILPVSKPVEEESAEQAEAMNCAGQEEVRVCDVDELTRLTEEGMQHMTVAALRSAARKLDLLNMSKHDIRFAKKEHLIRVISAYLAQGR